MSPLSAEEAEYCVCKFLFDTFGAECYTDPTELSMENHGECLFPLYANAGFARMDQRQIGSAYVAPNGGIHTIPDIAGLREKIKRAQKIRYFRGRIQNALGELAEQMLRRSSS